MNSSSDSKSDSAGSGRSLGKLKAGGGLLGVLAVIYALLQPILSEKLGVQLPSLPIGSDQPAVASADSPKSTSTPAKSQQSKQSSLGSKIQVKPAPSRSSAGDTKFGVNADKEKSSTQQSADKTKQAPASDASSKKTSPTKSAPKIAKDGPLANRIRPPPSDSTKSSPSKSAPAVKSAPKSDPNLKYGILQPLGRDNFISPAGLRYTPGSAEGHRLKHLERHTKDQPTRPGKHGVFEGGMEKTLQVMDQAYEKAKRNDRTTKTEDKGRTIYTVDMGKRIGYIGGRDGNRMRKPMARRVRMVLEGNRVITAYPL